MNTVKVDNNIMASCPQQYKKVKDGMVKPDSLDLVEYRTRSIGKSTGQQPKQTG